MARDEGRPLATSSIAWPFRGLQLAPLVKVMLHGTIPMTIFSATQRCSAGTMSQRCSLQRCVALKIVVANRSVTSPLKKLVGRLVATIIIMMAVQTSGCLESKIKALAGRQTVTSRSID